MRRIIITLIGLIGIAYAQTPITYTPMTAAGYQYKYVKIDSGLNVPYLDTTLGRGTTRAGSIVMRPQNKTLYYWDGTVWNAIGAGGSTTIINYIDSSINSVVNYIDSATYITQTGVTSTTYDSATRELCVTTTATTTCYTITDSASSLTTSPDSVIIRGTEICVWKDGVSDCHSIQNTVINNTYINNYATNNATIKISGEVVYDSLLVFHGTPFSYYINGDYYTSELTYVTLDDPLPSVDRTDVFYVDTLGNFGVLTGESNGLVPQVDPASQLAVAQVVIPSVASGTTTNVGNLDVYKENIEWTGSSSLGTVNFNYATNPYEGVKSIYIPSYTNNTYIRFLAGATYKLSDVVMVKMRVRLTSAFRSNNRDYFSIKFQQDSIKRTNFEPVLSGTYGFDRSVVGSWQEINIPISEFQYGDPNFNEMYFNLTGTGTFQLDNIILQTGTTGTPINVGQYVETVDGLPGPHVRLNYADTMTTSADSSVIYIKNKLSGKILGSSLTYLTYLRSSDTCLVIDTVDSRNFTISFNQFCGGSGGSSTDTTSLSNRINAKQDQLTLTTTGTSGAATLVGATLNIPQYTTDISGKLNISDTAAMLLPYRNKINQNTDSITAHNLRIILLRDSVISHNTRLNTKLENITGLVTAGTNVTVTGSGTSGSPYVVNSSGGGGGSGITKAQVPFKVNVAGDSITRRFNVLDYLPGFVSNSTDATAGIQAAINAADAAGGGTVFFPTNIYLISGAINGTYNSQLYIPVSLITSSTRNAIILEGENSNLSPYGGGLSGGQTVPPPTTGAILKSTLTTFTTAGQAVIGTATGNRTSLIVKNMGIQVKNNPGGAGPVVGGINWVNGGNMDIENTYVVIDTAGFRSTSPTHNISAIETPINNQGESYKLSSVTVGGFMSGIKMGEHVSLNQVNVMTCYFAFYVKAGNHTSTAVRVGSYWNVYDFYFAGSPSPSLSNVNLDVEWQQIGKWYDNTNTIKDSANQARGNVFYTIVASGGKDNTKFSKSGATEIYALPVDNGVAGLKSNVFYNSSGTLTQTFNQVAGASANLIFQRNGVSKYTIGMDAGSANYNDFHIFDHTGNRNRFYMNAAAGDMRLGGNISDVAKTGITLDTIGNVAFASSNLYFNALNASVGIGAGVGAGTGITLEIKKANPYFAINSSTSRQGGILFQQNGTNKWQIHMDRLSNGTADFGIYDQTNTKHRFFINPTGDVFIGGTASALSTSALNIPQAGTGVGFGNITPTAKVHIAAGTASSSTSPLKFSSGTQLTTPEAGVLETSTLELKYSTSTTANSRGFIELARIQSTATGLTAGANDNTIVITATGQTITLPTAVGIQGRIYTIKLSASGTGTVATTSSQTIDGVTTYSLSAQYKYVRVQSDNANWHIIANN